MKWSESKKDACRFSPLIHSVPTCPLMPDVVSFFFFFFFFCCLNPQLRTLEWWWESALMPLVASKLLLFGGCFWMREDVFTNWLLQRGFQLNWRLWIKKKQKKKISFLFCTSWSRPQLWGWACILVYFLTPKKEQKYVKQIIMAMICLECIWIV